MNIGFILDGMAKDMARDEGRELARKFGGQNETQAVFRRKFNHMWELTWRAKAYADAHHDAMRADVSDNLNALAGISDEVRSAGGVTGMRWRRTASSGRDDLRTYRTAPVSDSYVVFSDIHITDADNRQDFFARFNKALYLDVLKAYYAPRAFNLIENGDIEELLIFEPDTATMPDFETASWSEIFADRETRKREQFHRILEDHADFYRVIHDGFVARGAYYRTIGNHDYDLASESYVTDLRGRLGLDWPTASDMLFLTDGTGPRMLVCHGHQFDAYTVATHAKRAGESFSQGGGWAYQGPDRYWNMEKDGRDFIDQWRRGSKDFVNMLVSDEPGLPATEGNVAEALAGKAIRNLHDPNKWEALYGKNVGWEYFRNSDPQKAFNDEVQAGERWYKFRHMNEIRIVNSLEQQFGTDGMQLLLGHSHEPRVRAGKPGPFPQIPAPAPGYLNAAAAGRFENLIWGIEIADGVSQLVSWSRDGQNIARTVWNEFAAPGRRYLRAGATDVHDPGAAVAQNDQDASSSRFPLEAITNLLFSH